MVTSDTVTIEVRGGPRIDVAWHAGMTVREALEEAYEVRSADQWFTYALQYYGPDLGYLVMMINENYDSFDVRYEPDFYWSMLVNGAATPRGVDHTVVQAGDVVAFAYEMRGKDSGGTGLVEVKHQRRIHPVP